MAKRQTDDSQALVPQSQMALQVQANIDLVERLATNKDVDVDKLERILKLQERAMEKQAQMIFSAAMTSAQVQMRKVVPRAKSERGKYATYDALDNMLRPIYTDHGFSLRYGTGQGDDPNPVKDGEVRVWIYCTHQDGHMEKEHVDMPLPIKGAQGGSVMNPTQGTGSAMSYGMRYLLKFFFNIAIGEDDRNGDPPRGGQDQRYKADPEPRAPSSKSDKRAATDAKKYGLEPAKHESTRIQASNVKTLEANMKRSGKSLEDFERDFGFKLLLLDRKDLNVVVDWMKEE